MGYPRSSFIRGAEIDPNLICQVCHEVFDAPVRTPCGHVFCEHCAGAWFDTGNHSCISCRAPLLSFDALQPDRVLANLIGNLKELESRVTHLENIVKSKSPKWLNELSVDDKVDAKDRFGRWYEATVVKILIPECNDDSSDDDDEPKLEIHFDGWSNKHNEVVSLDEALAAGMLAPLHTHTVRQRKRAKARKWREFEEGDVIDVCDTVEKWREGVVINLDDSRVFIHYTGWPNMWDEWIRKDSARLAPYLRTQIKTQRK
eukprot:g3475.t1